MNKFPISEELNERSKNDRAIIVGSEIRGAIQELWFAIELKDKIIQEQADKIERLKILNSSMDNSVDVLLNATGKALIGGK